MKNREFELLDFPQSDVLRPRNDPARTAVSAISVFVEFRYSRGALVDGGFTSPGQADDAGADDLSFNLTVSQDRLSYDYDGVTSKGVNFGDRSAELRAFLT